MKFTLSIFFSVMSLVLFFVACTAQTSAPLPPPRSVVSLTVHGTPRSYILRFPKAYDGKAKLPMVLLLHGATDSAAYAEAAYHFDTKADKEGFVLVIPDALGDVHAWSSSGDSAATRDDLAFLTTLLETLPKTYAIDPQRVFVTGHSAGAIMTYRLACDHPELTSAIGIVAGAIGTFPPPKGPVPIVAFHGKRDDVLPYEDLADSFAWWVKTNHCPATPSKTDQYTQNVTRDTYTPTDKNGADMVAYSLANGNHMWAGGNAMPGKTIQPVQDISATDLMWDFFKAHPRP